MICQSPSISVNPSQAALLCKLAKEGRIDCIDLWGPVLLGPDTCGDTYPILRMTSGALYSWVPIPAEKCFSLQHELSRSAGYTLRPGLNLVRSRPRQVWPAACLWLNVCVDDPGCVALLAQTRPAARRHPVHRAGPCLLLQRAWLQCRCWPRWSPGPAASRCQRASCPLSRAMSAPPKSVATAPVLATVVFWTSHVPLPASILSTEQGRA